MKYQAKYAPRAVDDLRGLDKKVAKRILNKINEYCKSGKPLKFAKSLKGDLSDAYRFRIGDYRVIFDIDGRGRIKILYVLRVGHRRKIYDLI